MRLALVAHLALAVPQEAELQAHPVQAALLVAEQLDQVALKVRQVSPVPLDQQEAVLPDQADLRGLQEAERLVLLDLKAQQG